MIPPRVPCLVYAAKVDESADLKVRLISNLSLIISANQPVTSPEKDVFWTYTVKEAVPSGSGVFIHPESENAANAKAITAAVICLIFIRGSPFCLKINSVMIFLSYSIYTVKSIITYKRRAALLVIRLPDRNEEKG